MADFWQGKRVVVTGGAGFLGSHLVSMLIDAGAEVIVYDIRDNARMIDGAVHARIDVSGMGAIPYGDTDVVFNLAAAVAGVRHNLDHDLQMFVDNIAVQTAPVVAAAEAGVETLVQVSSVCVYDSYQQARGCFEGYDIFVHDPHPANAGYAWAKRMGEQALLWSDISRRLIVRPANLYGPGDNFFPIERAHVIPALVAKALDPDRPAIEVYGTGEEIREFLYVEDAARGLMAVAEHGADGEAYNLSTDGRDKTSIRHLAGAIREAAGVDKPVRVLGGAGGDPLRWVRCGKVQDATGWRAEVDLAEGLRQTVAWYKENAHGDR